MEKRLNLSKELLVRDGVIFMSIDDNEVFNLKLLSDKIFGENNFIGQLIPQNNSSKNQAKLLSISTEYILCYAKDKELLKNQAWRIEKRGANDIIHLFTKLKKMNLPIEEIESEIKDMYKRPKYAHLSRWNKVDNDGVFVDADLSREGGAKNYTIINPSTKEKCIIPPRGWGKSYEELINLQKSKLIWYGNPDTPPREKKYISIEENSVPDSFFYFDNATDTKLIKSIFGSLAFENPKPLEMIIHILKMIPKKDAKILDFFAGSGTTAHAVIALNNRDNGNRKFILCTNNENNICTSITYPRINTVIKGYTIDGKIFNGINTNLKYFKTKLLEKNTSPSQTKINLTNECSDMLCVKENIFNLEIEHSDYKIFCSYDKKKYLCIYFNTEDDTLAEFLSEIKKIKEQKALYIFSETTEVDQTIFKGIKNFSVEAIPQKILDIYKHLVKQNISPKTNTIFLDLEKAKKRIFEEIDKDDGAMKLRVVLEKIIESIGYINSINLNEYSAIARLNTKLKDDGIFTKVQWKENETYLTIGNHASHGEYENYDIKQTKNFYKHVKSLIDNFGIGK